MKTVALVVQFNKLFELRISLALVSVLFLTVGGNQNVVLAKTTCQTNVQKFVVIDTASPDASVNAAALSKSCILVSDAILNKRNIPNALNHVIDAELKYGAADAARGDMVAARKWWSRAIISEHHNTAFAGNIAALVFPNTGLSDFAQHRYRAGFAWYAALLTPDFYGADPSLMDSGYYDNLGAGLNAAATGASAISFDRFNACLGIAPGAPDALFFQGILSLESHDLNAAKTSWLQSIKLHTFGSGITPKYDDRFGVASAYMYLRFSDASRDRSYART